MEQAARTRGEAQVDHQWPPLPDDCRVMEPHAPVVIGTEALSGWKRERRALDRANARVGRCAGFYDAATGRPL
ncbi:hypothetical protein CU102_12805 [Phyllobacterium brassicacearum]|uniref:Uncharacterized protein n=1 Tax=Phyllobacterium brassicacearum TaxID=314235 RepID=A0A2P7BQB6_9HYPH|nr:hypothetical protein [Phyllobacterium brassicacearum]PSH68632.1 hypothetical protein CU102_12805 [Phyllobacterium brassicacearum]